MKQDAHTGPSFTLSNRLARVVWGFACLLTFRWTPRPLHAWRAFILRCFGARLGKNCHIYPRAIIWAPWNLECGDEAAIADHVNVYNQARITIGKRSVISQGSHLCSGTHNYESPAFELVAFPINIGDHVWVCADCFVGPGVTIGEGVVAGARSVVVKDLPPWMVCAGHPCKPIKPRKIQTAAQP
jgi:putative colanic acid biosynthesis acetyltransferase WcaF